MIIFSSQIILNIAKVMAQKLDRELSSTKVPNKMLFNNNHSG